MVAFFLNILLLISPQQCEECVLLEKGWNYFQKNEIDSAIHYFQKSRYRSINSGNELYEAFSHINLANAFQKISNYDSSIFYNEKAYQVFVKIGDLKQQFHTQRNLAMNFNNKGLFRTSLVYLKKAEELVAKIEEPTISFQYHLTLGRTLEELESYDRALESYDLASDFSANKKNEIQLLTNIGNVLMAKNLVDSANRMYMLALNETDKKKHPAEYGMLITNLSEIAIRNNKWREANSYIKESLEVKRKVNQGKLATSYYRMAKVLIHQELFKQAKSYLDSAIDFGIKTNDLEVLIPSYETLADYFQTTKEFNKSIGALRVLDSLKTKRFNVEKLESNRLQATYDLEVVNEKLDRQILINENQRLINIIILLGTVLSLIVATVFFFLFRNNLRLRRKNEYLLKEQNHRVKNNLQMINSLTSLQAKKITSRETLEVLNESQSRINSVALLHRMLYKEDDLSSIKLQDYLSELTEELKHTSSREIEILHSVSEIQLDTDKATGLGLIVAELVINSAKHVDPDTSLKIDIKISAGDGHVKVDYRDNGMGFKESLWNKKTSFGNQLVGIQVSQLRGSYHFEESSCFHFILDFPT